VWSGDCVLVFREGEDKTSARVHKRPNASYLPLGNGPDANSCKSWNIIHSMPHIVFIHDKFIGLSPLDHCEVNLDCLRVCDLSNLLECSGHKPWVLCVKWRLCPCDLWRRGQNIRSSASCLPLGNGSDAKSYKPWNLIHSMQRRFFIHDKFIWTFRPSPLDHCEVNLDCLRVYDLSNLLEYSGHRPRVLCVKWRLHPCDSWRQGQNILTSA
jgi:hypothetical protein